MKKLLVLFFLLSSSPAIAQICGLNDLFIDPNPAWYGEEIDVRLRGTCSSGPGPAGVRVVANGSTITLELGSSAGGPLIPFTWGERAVLGKLFPGTYELIVRLDDAELRRETLEVRPRPFRVAPMIGTAGTRVVLRGLLDIDCLVELCEPVRFGGVPATNYQFHESGDVSVTVPPHVPGVVDVTLHLDGTVVTLPGGFRYGDPVSEADYDRVMFPTTFGGRGSHGSDWFPDIVVHNSAPVVIETEPLTDMEPPPPILPILVPLLPGGKGRILPRGTDGGMFFYVQRGAEEYLSYASHIVDRSRIETDRGSEIPVVRAGDTAAELHIPQVAIDSRYRVRLRIYDFDAIDRPVLVRAIADDGSIHSFGTIVRAAHIVCPTTPCLQPEPAFAAVDLSAIASLQGKHIADLRITSQRDARLWAYVTVTNNETQSVTIHTPQQMRR